MISEEARGDDPCDQSPSLPAKTVTDAFGRIYLVLALPVMVERAAGTIRIGGASIDVGVPLILFAAESDHADRAVEMALFRSSSIKGDLHGVGIFLIFIDDQQGPLLCRAAERRRRSRECFRRGHECR